jgi:hypothetical protein
MNYSKIIPQYNRFIKQQERDKVIVFLKGLVTDLEKFNDDAKDYKAIISILESEDWINE